MWRQTITKAQQETKYWLCSISYDPESNRDSVRDLKSSSSMMRFEVGKC